MGGDGHRIDRMHPEKSLILQKPTFQISHGGGLRFALGAIEYKTILTVKITGRRAGAGLTRNPLWAILNSKEFLYNH